MDAMQLANSLPMWLACGTARTSGGIPAVIFTKKAMDAAPKVGLTNDQVKRAMKSSALTSLGPSVVILSGMLSLLVSVGGPMAGCVFPSSAPLCSSPSQPELEPHPPVSSWVWMK